MNIGQYYAKYGTHNINGKQINLHAAALPVGKYIHYLSDMLYPDEMTINKYAAKYNIVNVAKLIRNKQKVRYGKLPALDRIPNLLRRPPHTVNRNVDVFFNYGALNKVIYSGNVPATTKASNIINTLISNMHDLSRYSDRPHIIVFDLPERNITPLDFHKYSKLPHYALSKVLKSNNEYYLIDLYRWLNKQPSSFSAYPTDTPSYFALRGGDIHVMINMDYLYSLSNKMAMTSYTMNNTPYNLINNISEIGIVEVKVDEDDVVSKIRSAKYVDVPTNPDEAILHKLDNMVENGMSAKQYRAAKKTLRVPRPNPYSTEPVSKYVVVDQKDTVVKKDKYKVVDTVFDKTMVESNIAEYESKYINGVLDKHTMSVIHSMQKGGMIVNKHSIETQANIAGSSETHTLQVTMVGGAKSTIKFKIPTLNSDGTFNINGSEYRKRKQRVDPPIRKISPNQVTLISYYGPKQFIVLSELSVDNKYLWLIKRITAIANNSDSGVAIVTGNSYNNTVDVPKDYAEYSKLVDKITTPKVKLYFNYNKRNAIGTDKGKNVIIGTHRNHGKLWIGTDNVVRSKDKQLGYIHDILNVVGTPPKSTAYVTIGGARIYVGMYLCYLLGISKLFDLLKVKVTVHKPRTRADGYVIKTHDAVLSITNISQTASLILSGISKYDTHKITYDLLDTREGVASLLSPKGIELRHLNEYELIYDLFLDPITIEKLTLMNEPTVYIPLVVRACELLTTSGHTNTAEGLRIRGYERFPGVIYTEMVKGIRSSKRTGKMVISPYAVWSSIKADSANKISEHQNPVAELRDSESVILSGDGGRSSDTITIDARKFDVGDIGTISESVPDNGDAGISTYLTVNPNITDIYGNTTTDKTFSKEGRAKYYSTSHALMPGVDSDDFTRANFVGIHNQHTIAMHNMELGYVRTGYESIIPQRVSNMFAVHAPQDGTIIAVNKYGMKVKYADSTVAGYSLGNEYTKAEGAMYANNIITKLKKGDKFKKGHPLCWHDAFFTEDVWNPNTLLYKQQTYITIALYEGDSTYEDSCTVDRSMLSKLTANIIKPKEYVLEFTQNVRNMVSVGDTLEVGDPIMTLEDNVVGDGGFDKDILDSIAELSAQSPKSKYRGVVFDVKVLYNGNLSDMTYTLRKLATESDARLKAKALASNKQYFSGKVDSEYMVNGVPLAENTCVIYLYINVTNVPGNGDKFVFSSQLKCTISDVTHDMRTESGTLIESGFSGLAVGARIVGSFYEIGMANTLLKHLPNKLLQLYDK